MAEPSDLESRVAALERQVRDLVADLQHSRQDAAAARVLAGGADRDVAEIRTEIRDFREQNTRVLNALREDLTDFRTQVNDKFALVDTNFTQIRGALDQLAGGQQQITALLGRLIDRGDGDEPAAE